LGAERTGLFLRRWLDEANHVDRVEEIRAKAQRILELRAGPAHSLIAN
jgi:hypothetical protein